MACYKKVNGKWYTEKVIKKWVNLLKKRAKTTSRAKLREIDSKLDFFESLGFDDLTDPTTGAPLVDDIFLVDGEGASARSNGRRALDKLTVKAVPLRAQGITASDVYNYAKAKFDAMNVTYEQVAEAMTVKEDFNNARVDERAKNSTFQSKTEKTATEGFLSWLRGQVSKRGELYTKHLKNLWDAQRLRQGRIKSIMSRKSRNLSRLNRTLKKGGFENLTTDENIEISNYLSGSNTLSINNPSISQQKVDALKRLLDEVRLDIDLLTSLQQSYGGITNLQIAVFQNNKGQYLTASYKAFQNQEWVDELASGKFAPIMDGALRVIRPQLERRRDNLKAKIDKAIAAGKEPNDIDKIDYDNIVDALVDDASLNNYILADIRQLSERGANESAIDKRGKLKTKTIKQRNKDLSPEIKALLGEIDSDPAQAVSLASIRISERVANNLYQNEVADELKKHRLFLTSTEAAEANKRGWVSVGVTGEGNKGFRKALGGDSKMEKIFVPKEVEPFITGIIDATKAIPPQLKQTNVLEEGLGGASALMKKAVTVWNLAGQAVNYLGNPSFAISSGTLRPTNVPTYVAAHIQAISVLVESHMPNRDFNIPEHVRDILDLAQREGISDNTVVTKAIKELTDNNRFVDFTQRVGRSLANKKLGLDKVGDFMKRIDEVATASYEIGDEAFKITDLIVKLDEYAKTYGYKDYASINQSKKATKLQDKAVIEGLAATMVRNSYPNYGELYAFAKKNRASRLIGPFVAFVSEQMRTTHASIYNQIKFANDKTLPQALRNKFKRDLAYNITTRGVLGLIVPGMLTQLFGGLGEEEEAIIRDSLAYEFERSAGVIVDNGDGTYDVINSGYYNPAGFSGDLLLPIFNSLMNGSEKPIIEAMYESVVGKVVEPFVTPEFVVDQAILAFTGKDEYGRDIIQGTTFEAKYNSFVKAMKKVPGVPNLVKNLDYDYRIEQIETELAQEVERRGGGLPTKREKQLKERLNLNRKRLKSKELLSSRTLGARYTVHNKEQDVSYKFLNLKNQLAQDRANFKAIVDDDSFDKADAQRAYDKANNAYKKRLLEVKEFHDRVKHNMDDVDMDKVLSGKGKVSKSVDKKTTSLFSKKELAYITGGVTNPPELSLQDAKSRFDIGPDSGGKSKRGKRTVGRRTKK